MQINFSFLRKNHNEVLFPAEHEAEGLGENRFADFFVVGDDGIRGVIKYHYKNNTLIAPINNDKGMVTFKYSVFFNSNGIKFNMIMSAPVVRFMIPII